MDVEGLSACAIEDIAAYGPLKEDELEELGEKILLADSWEKPLSWMKKTK